MSNFFSSWYKYIFFAIRRAFCFSAGETVIICLQLYFDEVEPANPIGTRACIHKVGFFYWVLKNLPFWVNSDMRMIHMVAVASNLDLKRFGYASILRKISLELDSLRCGVEVTTRGNQKWLIRGAAASFVADNLAYHAVFGFTENFSSGRPCEKCTIEQKFFKKNYVENLRKNRSSISIEKIVTDINNGTHQRLPFRGVNRACALRTADFDPYENMTVDLQHDIFEGVAQYTIKCVLKHLIRSKYFTALELNRRLNAFYYGMDNDGKPSEMSHEKSVFHLILTKEGFY